MISKHRVNIVFVFSAVVGGLNGYVYGQNEHMKFYKLLNLFGLIYDFIAVVLLSYVVLVKDYIKESVAHYLSLVFIIFTIMFPASFQVM